MANFDAAKAIFTQIDANRDGSIDRNEFRKWAAKAGGASGLTASSYETPSFQSSNAGFDASAGLVGGHEANAQSHFESSATLGASANEFSSGATVQQTNEYSSQLANGLYKDPNPQIIRRQATGGPVTYQQRILVRFLQPPPVPPPGPLIIKEVRPTQPPPPPPLVVRQRAPPLPQPPPLILRERPPLPPASVGSQTIIRRLAAIPVPPRTVIIERLPPLPPKPRDIIIERWVPYGPQVKRRTIVQRAAAAVQYPKPRNIIVVYDTVQARVVRQFQRFGVVQENPQAYISRYGVSLLDAGTLVQQARAAGVVEDISPPTPFSSSSTFNVATGGGGGGTAGFNLSNATVSQGFSSSDATNFEGLQVGGGGIETGASGFEVANNASANYSSSSNLINDSAFADSVGVNNAGFNAISASFAAADTNQDGGLDRGEFQRFVQGGI